MKFLKCKASNSHNRSTRLYFSRIRQLFKGNAEFKREYFLRKNILIYGINQYSCSLGKKGLEIHFRFIKLLTVFFKNAIVLTLNVKTCRDFPTISDTLHFVRLSFSPKLYQIRNSNFLQALIVFHHTEKCWVYEVFKMQSFKFSQQIDQAILQ